jgi:hypothetical protein
MVTTQSIATDERIQSKILIEPYKHTHAHTSDIKKNLEKRNPMDSGWTHTLCSTVLNFSSTAQYTHRTQTNTRKRTERFS